MDKNKIITEIYNKCIIEKIASKLSNRFKREEDMSDYIQEMYLILLDMPEDKLFRLYTDKELDNYIAQIALNQLVNTQSKFHRLMEDNINKVQIEDRNGKTEEEFE